MDLVIKKYEYDVFISHAVEDKIEVANELVQKLQDYGLKVWYASNKLRVGYGTDQTIEEGFKKSRYGIVLLTHNYLNKDWPEAELRELCSEYCSSIFSVCHKISDDEVEKYKLPQVKCCHLDTRPGLDHVAKQLVRAMKGSGKILPVAHRKNNPKKKRRGKFYLYFGITLLLAAVLWTLWHFLLQQTYTDELVPTPVETHIVYKDSPRWT